MSANAPWSVKGIDAKAREVAKDLARRSGMTLGEWLNHMILEGEDVGALITRERARHESAPQRRIPEAAYHDDERYDADDYAPQPRQAWREPAYAEPAQRPVRRELREEAQRSAPFSSGARPLTPREVAPRDVAAREMPPRTAAPRDVRRGSIFADRPRVDDYEERQYATASDDLGRVARALESLGSRIETSETRSATAVRGVSHAVESLLSRLERSEAALEAVTTQTREELQDRIEQQSQEVLTTVERLHRRADEDHDLFVERLDKAERLIDAQAERLEGISGHVREDRERMAKLEAAQKNNQTVETVRAVEGALGKLANQLYEGDVRTRETVKDIRQDMVTLSHRLAQVETRDPERAAQGVIDKVVARMAQRLEAAEGQTSGAIRTLEAAFRNLEGRLAAAEERGDVSDPEAARSLTQLAADLSRRVEENRQELLGMLSSSVATAGNASAEQLLGRFEARLEESERRQAAAVERMGHEIVRMASSFDRRVNSVVDDNSAGLTRLGAEVTRVVEVVESRTGRIENAQAQALERLGGEIARISERLSAKMTETERRTKEVLTGIGQEFEQQRDQSRSELTERIRASEERTARLLDDARGRLDQKLAQVHQQSLLAETKAKATPARDELPSPFAPVAPAPAPAAEIETTPFSQFSGGFKDEAPGDVADDSVDLTGRLLSPVTDFKPEFDPFEDGDDEDFSAEMMQTPLGGRAAKATPPAVEDDSQIDDDPFADIDQARKTAPRSPQRSQERVQSQAARVAQPQVSAPDTAAAFEDDEDSGISISTRDALAAARAAVRASMVTDDKPLGGLRAGTTRISAAQARAPKSNIAGDNTLMKAFKASSLAVVLVGGGALGYLALTQAEDGADKAEEAPPVIAAALTPDAAAEDARNQQNLQARYDLAMQQISARKPGAVDVLKEVANQGYAPAQFKLSRIYAGEDDLVKPNKVEERRWTQRAAQGGYAQAMHYLGMQYYNGDGGQQDRSTAAMWFRKASERGITNSQFNLGLLYENGDGTALSPSEAYKWFSLAARSGDKMAAAAAERIRSQLGEDQLQKANAAVDSFTPISDDAPPLAASSGSQG